MTDLPFELDVEIVALLASPAHRYEGRPSDGPAPETDGDQRDHLEFVGGLGIVGDRYFNQHAHRASSVSIQAIESLEKVSIELDVAMPGLAQTRRNVLLRGVDIDALAQVEFSLDSGDGAVLFTDARPCNPCAWMNVTVGEGAHRAFRRRGGLRTGPVNDGILRVGPAILRAAVPIATLGYLPNLGLSARPETPKSGK
ncbi:MAG: molybdenum cofactor biosysynthesis protein [Pseudolysinimonas sp.]|uniref:molybdenum cofactor biosysynthesis protein n=1 Tax=Pseudolysinimonas sp. TaxID=2680009 RepID=UPI003264D0EC